MTNLGIVFALLLVLPFIVGYVHTGINKKTPPVKIYYRYFMFFNLVLAAFFVAGRMFLFGHKAAQISGWSFSPIFQLYGVAVLSIGLLGLVTLFVRTSLMLAPAICWTFFALLSTGAYVYELIMREVVNHVAISLHIFYNLVIAVIMLIFIFKLRQVLAAPGSSHAATVDSKKHKEKPKVKSVKKSKTTAKTKPKK